MSAFERSLRARLRATGLTTRVVNAAWPAWWSEEAEESASAVAELQFTLARRLGMSPRSLLSDRGPEFIWFDETKYKNRGTTTNLEAAVLASFSVAVSRDALSSGRRSLETASLKTIAAFMNSKEGGTLLIGVADDGSIHGLDSDYASRSKTGQDPRDWFQQHLANIVATSMGDAAATNVRPYLHHVDGHDVCRVQVDPSGFPVDAKVIYQKADKPKEVRTEFFVRVANGTKALDAVQREKYIAQRWGTGAAPAPGGE